MADADDSVTSRAEDGGPKKESSEDARHSGANSLRTTGSLAFNLEKYLLESSPQTNVGNRTNGIGAETPASRSSSVVKRGILRSPISKGIKLNLFGPEGESGMSGERFRAQTESIFIIEEPRRDHLSASHQREEVCEKGIALANRLDMSDEGQSSRDPAAPEGSNSGGRVQADANLEEVSDRFNWGSEESPKTGGVLRSLLDF
ncbi:hypothetical protein R1sor_001689 [Riccia sorocarpa]|uniref:Uncharacterized protein n=1 Tax=Riccia sorocarpa TaxID=122646 RepID=A0ABD3GZ54_9MARC